MRWPGALTGACEQVNLPRRPLRRPDPSHHADHPGPRPDPPRRHADRRASARSRGSGQPRASARRRLPTRRPAEAVGVAGATSLDPLASATFGLANRELRAVAWLCRGVGGWAQTLERGRARAARSAWEMSWRFWRRRRSLSAGGCWARNATSAGSAYGLRRKRARTGPMASGWSSRRGISEATIHSGLQDLDVDVPGIALSAPARCAAWKIRLNPTVRARNVAER